MTKKLNKKELIAVLVDDYGYEEKDIKLLTNAKLEKLIKQEEKDAEAIEHEETLESASEEYVQINDNDMVQVMSGTFGELTHRSQHTGRAWVFQKFGQTNRMPFIELVNIHNNDPSTLENCHIVILNNKVAEHFNLVEVYKNIIKPKDLDSLFEKSVEELEAMVSAMPHSMKLTFVSRAKELYKQDKLDSRALVNFIQNTFGFSLEDNAPLSDIV
jgi:hypothetical protein